MERQLEYGKEVHICFVDYSKVFHSIKLICCGKLY